MRELRLARRPDGREASEANEVRQHLSACEHRTVSKDGRIVCQKIVEGDPEVSPNVCRECPYKAIDCAHLRFSLRLSSPSPLVVRFNGRSEIWDDGPPRLALERAACAERVVPIHGVRACTNCALRQSLRVAAAESRAAQSAAAAGRVVSFPAREPLAAAG
jgi:hypothetical protein